MNEFIITVFFVFYLEMTFFPSFYTKHHINIKHQQQQQHNNQNKAQPQNIKLQTKTIESSRRSLSKTNRHAKVINVFNTKLMLLMHVAWVEL